MGEKQQVRMRDVDHIPGGNKRPTCGGYSPCRTCLIRPPRSGRCPAPPARFAPIRGAAWHTRRAPPGAASWTPPSEQAPPHQARELRPAGSVPTVSSHGDGQRARGQNSIEIESLPTNRRTSEVSSETREDWGTRRHTQIEPAHGLALSLSRWGSHAGSRLKMAAVEAANVLNQPAAHRLSGRCAAGVIQIR